MLADSVAVMISYLPSLFVIVPVLLAVHCILGGGSPDIVQDITTNPTSSLIISVGGDDTTLAGSKHKNTYINIYLFKLPLPHSLPPSHLHNTLILVVGDIVSKRTNRKLTATQ